MKVVRNHQGVDPQLLILLNNSKNIFSNQLPNMGADYIARLVFDFHAETVMMLYSGVVKGAICSRIFPEERFIEIVFCAVDSALQSRGCGRLLMNFLKYVIQYSEIYDMLACADNEAVVYFKKLGFNDKAINIDPKRWVGRIKDYDKVTLVHSKIYPEVDYMHFPESLKRQMDFLEDRIGRRVHGPLFDLADRWVPFKHAPSFLNRPLPDVIALTDCGELREEERFLVENYAAKMDDLKKKLMTILARLQDDEELNEVFEKRSPRR